MTRRWAPAADATSAAAECRPLSWRRRTRLRWRAWRGPQSPDYDKRREAILAAAAQLYARKGFPGASVAALAKACRTSKSLIYHYFPSKDDILYAVMAEHLDALTEAAETACASGSADDRLRALTVPSCGSMRARRTITRCC